MGNGMFCILLRNTRKQFIKNSFRNMLNLAMPFNNQNMLQTPALLINRTTLSGDWFCFVGNSGRPGGRIDESVPWLRIPHKSNCGVKNEVFEAFLARLKSVLPVISYG